MSENVKLVTTKPEAEIAADLKAEMMEAMKPALEIMDRAAREGLIIQWDALGRTPPFFNHQIQGLRVVKHY